MRTQWSPIENESPDFLAQCRGLLGQVWEYKIGHSRLLIRFFQKGSMAGFYLYCKACDIVHFDAYWQDTNLKIAISEDKYGKLFTITDGERLRIVCRAVFTGKASQLISIPD